MSGRVDRPQATALGLLGLGRMGAGMADRLVSAGHHVVGFDVDPDAVEQVVIRGVQPAAAVADLVLHLPAPRVVWMMLPPDEVTSAAIDELELLCEPGDIVVDGGNTNWRETVRHAARLRDRGIQLLDVGTSGGVHGAGDGYCLMAGGDPDAFEVLKPIFEALAAPGGYSLVGRSGAGHFVKMAHNAIEYGMLASFGEGFELMAASGFDIDLGQVASLWRSGSVVRSWLLDLLVDALAKDPGLANTAGLVAESGQGRWAVEAALEQRTPLFTLTCALYERFRSNQDGSFSARVVAALRGEFGGHHVPTRTRRDQVGG